MGYYFFDYNAEDKKSFMGICDCLLEDSDRRRKGDFYTPTIWVDEAHKTISDNLGCSLKKDYMPGELKDFNILYKKFKDRMGQYIV